jgi:molybdate transport system substrate-binding protein
LIFIRRFMLSAVVSALALGLGATLSTAAGRAPTIAAASDLSAALPDVAAAFQARTGRQVRLTFGSSGNFTQQILNGAPYEVFLSADEAYVETLRRAGRTEGPGTLYGTGRIGIFTPTGSPVRADAALSGLASALQAGQVSKVAIANPEHAPYGRAAKEALQASGLWDALQGKLILGENVSQATQFAINGGAQAGIVPLSLALTAPVKAAGTFVLIPADRHAPLRQRGVLIRGSGTTAKAFYAFLQGREARAILTRYGFTVPTVR